MGKVLCDFDFTAGAGKRKGAQSKATGNQPPSPPGMAPLPQKAFLSFRDMKTVIFAKRHIAVTGFQVTPTQGITVRIARGDEPLGTRV